MLVKRARPDPVVCFTVELLTLKHFTGSWGAYEDKIKNVVMKIVGIHVAA